MRFSFLSFIRWYLSLKSFERSGQIYRWIGIPQLDRVLAGLFGEPVLEPYAPGSTISRAYLHNTLIRGQYNEVVNGMCALIYIGLAILCAIPGYWGLMAWSLLITAHHAMILPIERYKRALGEEWLRHEDAFPASEPEPEPVYMRSEAELKHWYYQPRSFESEKFYDRLGVHSFRIFVFWLTKLAESIADDEHKEHSPNQLKRTTAEDLEKFEKGTRTSELVHLFGVLEHLPFAIVFVQMMFWPGLIYLAGMAYLNVYAILLQRQHRARLFKVLLKRARKNQPPA